MNSFYARTPSRAVLAVFAATVTAACGRTVQSSTTKHRADVDSTSVVRPPDSARSPARTPAALPVLQRITPESARVVANAVLEIRLDGSGFELGPQGANDVEVGPVRLRQVPANSAGRQLQFVLPDRVPESGEAPPRRLFPGDYPVTVTTRAGKSNALSFRVLP